MESAAAANLNARPEVPPVLESEVNISDTGPSNDVHLAADEPSSTSSDEDSSDEDSSSDDNAADSNNYVPETQAVEAIAITVQETKAVEAISVSQQLNVENDLISYCASSSFYELNNKIQRLKPVEAPSSSSVEAASLFNAIGANRSLEGNEKCQIMMKLLFEKNYYHHHQVIFTETVLTLFYSKPKHLQLMYLSLCERTVLASPFETEIWKKLIQADAKNASIILKHLHVNAKAHIGTLLNFIKVWFNSINTTGAIVAAYRTIEKILTGHEQKYLNDIKDIAALRIDEIKLSQNQFKQDTPPVRDFMKSPHFLFFSCRGSSASPTAVYSLIKKNKSIAKEEYAEAETKVATRINAKLGCEPERQVPFSFAK